jgi:chromate reductase
MAQFRLLGLSGSLRRASNSTAVLRGLQDALGPRAALDIFPLHAIPLYNEDDDAQHAPESVRALRSAIDASDGVIIISPEYNHGMSGVLKNALDWASRPYGLSVLKGKPVLTMTASPALHRRCARAAADERDARIDTGTSCFSAPDRDRRRA